MLSEENSAKLERSNPTVKQGTAPSRACLLSEVGLLGQKYVCDLTVCPLKVT